MQQQGAEVVGNAYRVVDQVCAQVKLSRPEHVTLMQALEVLKNAAGVKKDLPEVAPQKEDSSEG